MKAMIFAAGLGTRLRPLTNDRPKALVEVAGKTMLQRVVEHLAQYGFHDITINIHHFGNQILDFLKQNNNFGQNIHISDERNCLLDTGGGLLHARKFLDGEEPFLIQNVDILTNMDLNAMYQAHQASGGQALATLLVEPRKTQRYLLFNEQNTLKGWINKATLETKPENLVYNEGYYQELAFGGVHVVSPHIFNLLKDYAQNEKKFPIVPFYIKTCSQYAIQGYQQQAPYRWFDIGKPETLASAQSEFA